MSFRRWHWLGNPFWQSGVWAAIAVGTVVILAWMAVGKSYGAWGTAGCGPVGSKADAKTGWRFYRGRHYYFRNGVQVGGWDPEAHIYRSYDATTGQWSEPQPPPWQAACACCKACSCDSCACPQHGPCTPNCTCSPTGQFPNWMTHGVAAEKISKQERYTLNGREVGGGEIPKDGKRLRLTIIGSEAERKKVTDDLKQNPLLMPLTLQLMVRDYAPEHWHVARSGFVTTGHPTIYLQAPDGKVLHRSENYAGPAQLAEAIRKADPNYDPKKDPDLAKKETRTPVPALPVYVLGSMGALYVAWRMLSR